ncbi:MAG TPA: immunoglobulin domain-containing protein [Opitutaceae bacterium]
MPLHPYLRPAYCFLLLALGMLAPALRAQTLANLVSVTRNSAATLRVGDTVNYTVVIAPGSSAVTSVTLYCSGLSWEKTIVQTSPASNSVQMTAVTDATWLNSLSTGAVPADYITSVEIRHASGTRSRFFNDGSRVDTAQFVVSGTHTASFANTGFRMEYGPNAPWVTTQPASQTVAPGASVTFSFRTSSTAFLRYQWQKNQAPISGATSATYTIARVTTADAGRYRVYITSSEGIVTSEEAVLTVSTAPAATAPAITTQPASLAISAGASATFNVAASGTAPLSYQWRKNGVAISGATSASYSINAASAGDAATYTVVVSNSAGSVTSQDATLTVTTPGKVKNISVRIVVPDGGLLTAGFVLDSPKKMLVRAVGASLAQFGVPAATTMADPSITVYNSAGAVVAQNDNFTSSATLNAATSGVGAFGLSSAKDAALLIDLPAGAFTLQLRATDGKGGDCLVEAYDADGL